MNGMNFSAGDIGMELYDVYDGQGNWTGKVKSRGDATNEGEYHLVAVLWLVNPQGELLIQKRAPDMRFQPNKWAFTGGAVLAGAAGIALWLYKRRRQTLS